MADYFVIRNSDGDTHVDVYEKDGLISAINDKDWGDVKYPTDAEFASMHSDTNYWGDTVLIIKGTVVSPSPKKVIETYEID